MSCREAIKIRDRAAILTVWRRKRVSLRITGADAAALIFDRIQLNRRPDLLSKLPDLACFHWMSYSLDACKTLIALSRLRLSLLLTPGDMLHAW